MRPLTRPAAVVAILALVLSLVAVVPASAVLPTPPLGGVQLDAVQFIDAQHGWAVGGFRGGDGKDYSFVERTTDGGVTWTRSTVLAQPDAHYLVSVSFATTTTGYAVDGATRDYVYKTVDGGATWTKLYVPTGLLDSGNTLESVRFFDATHGYASGQSGDKAPVVWSTADGGLHWQMAFKGPVYEDSYGLPVGDGWLHALSGYDGTHVLAAGQENYTSSALAYRFDGATWNAEALPAGIADLEAVSFASGNDALAVGPFGKAVVLTAGGWSAPATGLTSDLEAAALVDANHGWAVGANGRILFWNGSSFAAQNSGTTARLRGVWFTDASNGWAVGDGETLLRTNDGGAHWIARETAPPTTAISGVPAGWTNSNVQFGLSAADPSGVLATYYSINGGPTVSYAGTVTVSDEGTIPIAYRSVDTWGNSESTNTATARIDKTKPTTTDDHVATYAAVSTIHLSPGDTFSGVSSTQWTVDGGPTQSGTSVPVTGGGDHTLRYWSTDVAGNREDTHTVTYTVPDTTTPTTSVNGIPAGWSKTNVSFTLNPSDEPTNTITTKYRVDGGSWTSYASTVTLTSEGTHTIDYYSADQAGNTEATKTATARIDKTPPVTTATTVYGDGTATVTLQPNDAVSGVAATAYTLDGGPAQSGTSIAISGIGTHAVEYWSTDAAGNGETTKTLNVTVATLDTTPPTTAMTPLAPTAWAASDFNFTLSGADEPTHTVTTYYAIDGGTLNSFLGTGTSHSATMTISADGTHTVDYYSVDDSLNREATHTATVRIDKTPPVTTATTADGDGTATVTLHPADTLSGVASTSYTVDGGSARSGTSIALGFGPHAIAYHSTDAAGNAEATKTLNVVVDNTAPTTSISGVPAGWSSTDVLFSLTASDEAWNTLATKYRIDGGSWVTYSATVNISTDGIHTIDYYSVDQSNNTEATKTATARIDKTPPSSTVSQAKNVVTLGASDTYSGVDRIYYTLDGGSQTTYSAPFTVTPGAHQVSYWAVDKAGNAETPHAFQAVVPVFAPVSGEDRYGTAVDAAEKAFPSGASTVVLARGDDFPDALGGSSLCGANGAPLLLTKTSTLPKNVADEIDRLGATHAIILGGGISQQVQAAVAGHVGGSTHVQRIAGGDRYDTAARIAATAVGSAGADDVFLARGDAFSDALAASPAAYAKKWPILLTKTTGLPSQTVTAISSLRVKRVHILGSAGAVPQSVEAELKSRFPSVAIDRWEGKDRYGTAVDVAVKSGLSWNNVALATGLEFPDALGGGVMQGKLGGVLLLTKPTELSYFTNVALTEHKADVRTVRYLGATTIKDNVKTTVSNLLQ